MFEAWAAALMLSTIIPLVPPGSGRAALEADGNPVVMSKLIMHPPVPPPLARQPFCTLTNSWSFPEAVLSSVMGEHGALVPLLAKVMELVSLRVFIFPLAANPRRYRTGLATEEAAV
jgi:hypothetical protein